MARRIMIAYNWRYPKVIIALFCLEFLMTVACLTLYGIADPNTYRTKLWQNGADQGFNSSPNEILYAYANHRPINPPVVWSNFLVQFNIVISVFSMFVLLCKTTMWVMHAWIPLLSAVVHAILIVLYSISLRSQSTPDLSDPDHPARGLPWYLSKGCSYATPANHGYCMQARAVFGVTIVMVILFSTYFLLSCWNMIPTPAERAVRDAEYADDIEMKKYTTFDPDVDLTKEERWEKNRQMFMNLPKTPNTQTFGLNPMTPRTVAFTQLNGGSGQQRPDGRTGTATSPSGALPFREYFQDQKVPDGR